MGTSKLSGFNLCSFVHGFQSIGVPSEWGLDELLQDVQTYLRESFQSIGVPSEWGLFHFARVKAKVSFWVSNQ